MLHFEQNAFHAQKRGNTLSEYEDAFAFSLASGQLRTLRVAISDGATESSFAGEWAKMLVRNLRDDWFSDADDLKTRIEALGNHWKSVVKRRPLPWFAEEKVRQGAFATLLAIAWGRRTVASSSGRRTRNSASTKRRPGSEGLVTGWAGRRALSQGKHAITC